MSSKNNCLKIFVINKITPIKYTDMAFVMEFVMFLKKSSSDCGQTRSHADIVTWLNIFQLLTLNMGISIETVGIENIFFATKLNMW